MLIRIFLPYDVENHLEEIAVLSESRNSDFQEEPKLKEIDSISLAKEEK